MFTADCGIVLCAFTIRSIMSRDLQVVRRSILAETRDAGTAGMRWSFGVHLQERLRLIRFHTSGMLATLHPEHASEDEEEL